MAEGCVTPSAVACLAELEVDRHRPARLTDVDGTATPVHQAAATPPASRRKRQQSTLPAKPRASPDDPTRLAGSKAARSNQGDDDRTRVVLGSNLAKNRLSIGLS